MAAIPAQLAPISRWHRFSELDDPGRVAARGAAGHRRGRACTSWASACCSRSSCRITTTSARAASSASGVGHHRLHARAAPRLRRRPHRRDRQHHAQADDRRPAAAQRRLLLLARPLDDRLRCSALLVAIGVRGLSGAVENDGSSLHQATGLVGPGGLRLVPVPDRDPQPGDPGQHRRGSSGACARATSTRPSSSDQLNKRGLMNRFYGRATRPSASRGRCTRSASCSASASTPPPRSRCSCSPARRRRERAAVLRDPLPADPVRRRHVAARHDRRRVHELRLRLGVLEAGPEDLLQHHDHRRCRWRSRW